VAVFFTGDELTMPGEPLAPGAIYNSNRFTLRALLENLGCEISDFGIVPDTLAATRSVLRESAQGHDLIITSGGVSVGEEDHIKPAVEAEGKLNMWQIAVKPGKPLAFGEVQQAFFIGLPGNPVSSFVTFLMFVRPFILRLQGVKARSRRAPTACAPISLAESRQAQRIPACPHQRQRRPGAVPQPGLGRADSTVWGDGVIDNPPGQTIAAGDMVRFIPFSELLY
jgi:molybdopterin molybdotransferase